MDSLMAGQSSRVGVLLVALGGGLGLRRAPARLGVAVLVGLLLALDFPLLALDFPLLVVLVGLGGGRGRGRGVLLAEGGRLAGLGVDQAVLEGLVEAHHDAGGAQQLL